MKLIRDNYIAIIPLNELECYGKNYDIQHLKDKLDEEIQELKVSNFNDIEEYADVLEVLDELAIRNNISLDEIYKVKNKKNILKGQFKNGVFLK